MTYLENLERMQKAIPRATHAQMDEFMETLGVSNNKLFCRSSYERITDRRYSLQRIVNARLALLRDDDPMGDHMGRNA